VFTFTHIYTVAGPVAANFVIRDKDGGTGFFRLQLDVTYILSISIAAEPSTVTENIDVRFPIAFTAPTDGPHLVDIGFGDGTRLQRTVNVTGGTGSIDDIFHRYRDNDLYKADATIVAPGGGLASTAVAVPVVNVAPAAGLDGPAGGVRGQPRTLTLSAADPSPADQAAGFTFDLNFGNGVTQQVSGPSGTQINFTYPATGAFLVRVTATDKDGGVSEAVTLTVTIGAAERQGNVLAVGGTPGDDLIVVANSGPTLFVGINNVLVGTFDPATAILTFGQDGDDFILNATPVPSIVEGGDGNDVLVGGFGVDFLSGGPGNDVAAGRSGAGVMIGGPGIDLLFGGDGDDLMIGGDGSDYLDGGFGDDLLVGGTTDHDSALPAVAAVLAEWTSERPYADRVANLRGVGTGLRLNGDVFLSVDETVHDDGVQDLLVGGGERDWYFARLNNEVGFDTIADRMPDEEIDIHEVGPLSYRPTVNERKGPRTISSLSELKAVTSQK
jgi:Ca2+-binding RTX toxin-like protein